MRESETETEREGVKENGGVVGGGEREFHSKTQDISFFITLKPRVE